MRFCLLFIVLCYMSVVKVLSQEVKSSSQATLEIRALSDSIYIYTTYGDAGGGYMFPSNSMYVLTTAGVVMIDVPWDTSKCQALVDTIWQRHQLKPVFCLATHFHEDRTAAFYQLQKMGIPTYSTQMTDDILQQKGAVRAQHILSQDTIITIGDLTFEVFYPGKGHAPDNIVVWLPKEKLLYGGCFIKSTSNNSIGNLSDAHLEEWLPAVSRVEQRFPKPRWIITGHERYDSTKALKHTKRLIKRSIRAQKL
jgi:metallo-beta-lactamase class B